MGISRPCALVFVTTLASVLPAAGSRGGGLTPEEFRSQSLGITAGGVMASPDSRAQLALTLTNKTDRALWLVVRFAPPAPDHACEETQRLEAKGEGLFTCAQEALVADVDYPITIGVFGDSGLTEPIETNATHMRFGKKGVKRLEEWIQATRLPQTYENVILKDKVGMGTLFGNFANAGGKLVVAPEGLEHITKKRTVKVPAAQLRGVDVQGLGERAWVRVDYEDAGAMKTLVLQGSAIRGQGPEILDMINTSIQALLSRREKPPVTAAVVVGSAADATLQADIRTAVLKLEAGADSNCEVKLQSAEPGTADRSARYAKMSAEDRKGIDDALRSDRLRIETWRGTSCDAPVAYEVWLVRSADGGTDISATRLEPEVPPANR